MGRGGRGRGSAQPHSCEPLAVLSSEARGLCATVHLSPHATLQQPSEAKGLLGSIDHVEEAILVLLLLVYLRDGGGHTDHAVLVHQQEEGLGGIQLQAAPVGASAGEAGSAHLGLTASSTSPAMLFPWGQASTASSGPPPTTQDMVSKSPAELPKAPRPAESGFFKAPFLQVLLARAKQRSLFPLN